MGSIISCCALPHNASLYIFPIEVMMLNEKGHEVPDPIPVEIPLQWRRPPTIQEQIKMFVRRELSQQAAESGHETFEDADDFDVDDDFDPTSPYEENFDVYEAPNKANASGPGNPGTPEGSRGNESPTEGIPSLSAGSASGGTTGVPGAAS